MRQITSKYWPLVLILGVIFAFGLPRVLVDDTSIPAEIHSQLLLQTVPSLLAGMLFSGLFLFVLLQVIRGEQVDANHVQTSKEYSMARLMALAGVGFLVISAVASILPFMSEMSYGWEHGLLMLGSLIAAVSIVCFSIMQRMQANMYWVRLRSRVILDEFQSQVRLRTLQSAYWASVVVLMVFLLFAYFVMPWLIGTLGDTMRDNGTLPFNWQPFINLIIAVVWMPGIVAAFTSRREFNKK